MVARHETDRVVIISDKRNFGEYLQAYNVSPIPVTGVKVVATGYRREWAYQNALGYLETDAEQHSADIAVVTRKKLDSSLGMWFRWFLGLPRDFYICKLLAELYRIEPRVPGSP